MAPLSARYCSRVIIRTFRPGGTDSHDTDSGGTDSHGTDSGDTEQVVALWRTCDLTRPWNAPTATSSAATRRSGMRPTRR
ncbi:MAG: hypothetical protein RI885_185 [Actinomycetota bacterium]